jgi:hypothetical protein
MTLGEVVYLPIAVRVVLYSLMGTFAAVAVRISRRRRLTFTEILVFLAIEAVLSLLTLPSVHGHGR